MAQPPLFDTKELIDLRETHRDYLNNILEERYSPFVYEAVKVYSNIIRRDHDYIMKGIKNEMNAVPHAKEFWSKAASFYSCKNPIKYIKMETDSGIKHRMYHIWAYTDFRERLLEDLQLNPKVFSFKLVKQHVRDFDNSNVEYYNTIMLIYHP